MVDKYAFFSHPDLEKLKQYTAETRGVKVADVEKLFDDVRKNIVAPLETLNKNRPGNTDNEKALEESVALCNTMKHVIEAVKKGPAEDSSAGHEHTAAPAA